jgi:hypothetical protein
MTPQSLLDTVIAPTLARYPRLNSVDAHLLLLAIALQESAIETRQQDGGPAHGFWQFERAGIHAVLTHPSSGPIVQIYCADEQIPVDDEVLYDLITEPEDDPLACIIARALLYSDPNPLPSARQEQEAWDYYYRNWRPGRPDRHRWVWAYRTASETIFPPIGVPT